jgi:molybdopterin-guanine dinucleotide biosynthesis protein A
MGRPKGLLQVNGQPILEYLLDQLNWQGPTLLITAPGREHPPGAARFDREIPDPIAGVGPIQGLLTALHAASTPLLAVTTVDMPAIRRQHLLELLQHLQSDPATHLLMTHRPGDPQAIEPFPLACRRDVLSTVSAHLDAGRRSLYSLAGRPGIRLLEAHWPPATWTNLNTPADLAHFFKSTRKF